MWRLSTDSLDLPLLATYVFLVWLKFLIIYYFDSVIISEKDFFKQNLGNNLPRDKKDIVGLDMYNVSCFFGAGPH